MPWKETRVMDERMKFVMRAREPGVALAQAAREFGISRKTGYKWLTRYGELGVAGLDDQSRAPRSCPHRTHEHVTTMLLETRTKYPQWGARKVLGFLGHKHPGYAWPAASTVHDLFVRAGLVEPRNRRKRVPAYSDPLAHADASNAVWSVDYKGQFELGDSSWCYPLTITDNYSRMVLGCFGFASISGRTAKESMELVFAEYGLPDAIRSDNGSPFATNGIHGLSALSSWWLSLGVHHERIEPGRPDQNGRHERMHLTLKLETARPAARTLQAQNERFRNWRSYFNETRPHEALSQVPPANLYVKSKRLLKDVAVPNYSEHDLTRVVQAKGEINFAGAEIQLGRALAGHRIGLVEIDVDVWLVTFADYKIGLFEPGDKRVSPIDSGISLGSRNTL